MAKGPLGGKKKYTRQMSEMKAVVGGEIGVLAEGEMRRCDCQVALRTRSCRYMYEIGVR